MFNEEKMDARSPLETMDQQDRNQQTDTPIAQDNIKQWSTDHHQEAIPQEQQKNWATAQQNRETAQQESDQARNFRALREKAEKAERERNELMKRLQEIEQHRQSSQDDEDEVPINPDDLVEGKHLHRYTKKMKKLEQKINEYDQKIYMISAESQLKAQYPDFEKVVSQENINTFKEMHPELAQVIASNPDLYNKGSAAYKLIKQFGIYRDEKYTRDHEIAQNNLNKPRSVNSVSPQQGDTPLSRANMFANGLTPELKKQLWKEMQEASERS